MKLMDTIKDFIKKKPGRPFGAVTKNRSVDITAKITAKKIKEPEFEVGESVLINQDNDPWSGFKVVIDELHDGFVSCKYAGKKRAYNTKVLSRAKDGFHKDFNYNR